MITETNLISFMGKDSIELQRLIQASEFVGTPIQAWEAGFQAGLSSRFITDEMVERAVKTWALCIDPSKTEDDWIEMKKTVEYNIFSDAFRKALEAVWGLK